MLSLYQAERTRAEEQLQAVNIDLQQTMTQLQQKNSELEHEQVYSRK